MPRLTLRPLATSCELSAGAPLADALFRFGVEFPCGGRGTCGRCAVRVEEGHLPAQDQDRLRLGAARVDQGWRLACLARAEGDLALSLAQWDMPVLADDSPLDVTPAIGRGIAIDLGTTTLVAQLVDLTNGRVLDCRSALNPQGRHGADVVSRINHATTHGPGELSSLIRAELGRMVAELAALPGPSPHLVTVAGNTVMHQLFCGFEVNGLAQSPFQPVDDRMQIFPARELGWALDARVRVLPCLGGFVGGDILAGILATRLHEACQPAVLVDLGTNGEIVVAGPRGIFCTATAAGPAFEGASISIGMRAASGAIARVDAGPTGPIVQVLGGGEARGVCGSGLVDAVAWGLDAGLVQASGRMATADRRLPLGADLALTQADIRQLQLAKGAIAAGVTLLLDQAGVSADAVERVYLAGAFGNYIDRDRARRIGLITFDPERQVRPSGNTSLLGAKLALFRPDDDFAWLRALVTHVHLDALPAFTDTYAEAMRFPAH